MSYANIAQQKFDEGYNCAESVLFSAIGHQKTDTSILLAAASGFGGGMGRKQEVCGAVTGAIMAIGLLNSPYSANSSDVSGETPSTKKPKGANYERVYEFMTHFEAEFGSVNCRKLLDGCDLTTPAGQELFKSAQMKKQLCHKYVRFAANYIEKLNK